MLLQEKAKIFGKARYSEKERILAMGLHQHVPVIDTVPYKV